MYVYMLHDLDKQKLIQVEWADRNKYYAGLGTKNLIDAITTNTIKHPVLTITESNSQFLSVFGARDGFR